MSLEIGQVIEGKYRVTRLLGEGGMGAVYECENTAIQKRFAIKVLHASVAENKDAVGRFEKEARAAGQIGSDHITEVNDLGTLPSGDRFMVMEFLDGTTLSGRIKDKGRLSPGELAPILVQLLEGLAAAHRAGIIHRDLKPDNVFLLRSKAGIKDFVKILDFGISKFNRMSGDSAMSMTRTGAVMGTPYYMSPEQAKGSKEIDGRSDLYSVGVILYEAVTGQLPFDADTFNELIFKIVLEVPPPPEQIVADLDPAFAAIVHKAMVRDPSQRFQSAEEFQQAILQWMQGGGVARFEESPSTAAARASMVSLPNATQPSPALPAAPARRPVGLLVGVALGALGLLGAAFALKPAAPPAAIAPAALTATAPTETTTTTTAIATAAIVPVDPAETATATATTEAPTPPPSASAAAKAPGVHGKPATDKKPPPPSGGCKNFSMVNGRRVCTDGL